MKKIMQLLLASFGVLALAFAGCNTSDEVVSEEETTMEETTVEETTTTVEDVTYEVTTEDMEESAE